MNKNILNCPFCGSNNVKPEPWLGTTNIYSVLCKDCGTRGPVSEINKQDAIVRWNKRHNNCPK